MYRVLDTNTTDSDQELICTGAKRVVVQIFNQPVILSFGKGVPPAYTSDPEPYYPFVGTLAPKGGFDAIKVRNYLTGLSARVILAPR
jgi:hypothetical protein